MDRATYIRIVAEVAVNLRSTLMANGMTAEVAEQVAFMATVKFVDDIFKNESVSVTG